MSLPLDLSSFNRDVSLDTLEKQLICPICLEVFTKPVVILPCQHNLCRKCANELYRVGIGGRFRCPSCRREVVLDRHGVYGLQRNLLVENIIDVYKQESAKSDMGLNSCSRPPTKPAEQITCEEHEGEKLNIYCISCQVPTCSLCKVFGAHNTCQVAPLVDVYQQQKTEVNDGIGSIVASNEHLQTYIQNLEEICRNIEDNATCQKQILCEKFDRMSGILEERRKIMTQQIAYEQEEKTSWVQSLVNSYSEHVSANSKLIQTAVNAMEEQEMVAFLQMSKSLMEKVSETTIYPTIETIEPGYENMDHYKVDFTAEERALYQLDFLKIEEEVEETLEEPDAEAEPESESESEPSHETESDGETVPDQTPNTENVEMQRVVSETQETPPAKVETKKDEVVDRSGMSTQQDQPELGCEECVAADLGIQSPPVEADDETTFYPSWYRPNNRQMLSSIQAKHSDVLGVSNHVAQLETERSVQSLIQQTQTSMSMTDSVLPANTENHAILGKDELNSPQGQPISEAEKNVSDIGDGSGNSDRASAISLQGEPYSVGAQDSRETEQNTCTAFNNNPTAPQCQGDKHTDNQSAAADDSVTVGPSFSAATNESTRLSFSFSWLDPLSKK